MDAIFFLIVLVVSVILHEVMHGYVANWLGDPTARLAGRLTLNPVSHIDPIGSLLLPIILLITNSPVLIGYAKPVPYNPYNLRGRWGETLVAAAGPLTNLVLAVVFGLAIRIVTSGILPLDPSIVAAFATIVQVNIVLAIFNLMPLPPLDGSKVLSGILPGSVGRVYDEFRLRFERLGVFSGILLILLLFYLFSPVFFLFLQNIFFLLTGI